MECIFFFYNQNVITEFAHIFKHVHYFMSPDFYFYFLSVGCVRVSYFELNLNLKCK